LLIATIVIALLYVFMVFSIAELSAALPHAGGFYSFTRDAFGPWGGYQSSLSTIGRPPRPSFSSMATGETGR
jgi:ethanolamine permease